MLGFTDAFSVVRVGDPPRNKLELAPCVNPPVPDKTPVTVKLTASLFVYVPVIAAVEKLIAFVPVIDFPAPEKVYAPVPLVNVPLFVNVPVMVKGRTTVLLQVPLLLTVTSPNVFVPVTLLKVKLLVIVVAPVTVKLHRPMMGVPLGTLNVVATFTAPVAAPATLPVPVSDND